MNEHAILPLPLARHVDQVCNCFESAWKAWQSGERPGIENFLGTTREPERSALLRELIQLEVYHREGRGETWRLEEYREQFPELDSEWVAHFAAGSLSSSQDAPSTDTAVWQLGETADNSPPSRKHLAFAGYEILETIRFGMAVVYKARQVRPQRLVAIKTLRPRPGVLPADLQRFLHAEADHIAALEHPHIVPIYEVGVWEGQPYFSMKWIEGGTLAQRKEEWQLPILDKQFREIKNGAIWKFFQIRNCQLKIVSLMSTIARAVHYAHQRAILHRDLKPANILLNESGQPYVSDFGLARSLSDIKDLSQGEIAGTPCYMSPEQAADQKGLSTTTDVYGLGAILYELLTGQPPFRAASLAETLRQVMEQVPEPPHRLNPAAAGDLEVICLHCLEKQPERRYPSAEALADDLDRFLAGKPIQIRPGSFWERTVKWAKRRPAVAALILLTQVSLLVFIALLVWQWQAAIERKKLAKVKDAAFLTLAVSEAQKLYSAEVIDRLKDGNIKVEVSHNYTLQKGTIPLPPTLTMILAKRISEKNSGRVRLYSDFPFPSREDRQPLDTFEVEALAELRNNPEKPFYRFEDWQGRPSLRFATADVMQKKCLQCHNEHKDSPKKDWKEGDVRGVLEVILPVD